VSVKVSCNKIKFSIYLRNYFAAEVNSRGNRSLNVGSKYSISTPPVSEKLKLIKLSQSFVF
jgi:hypothetical protein